MSLIIKILHGFGVWFWSKLGSKERHISDLLVPVLLVAIAAESVALYRGYERNRKIENTSKTLANSLSNIGKAPEKAVLSTKKGSIQALVATPSGLTNKNIKDRYSEDIEPVKSIGVNAKDVTGIQKITTDTHDTIYTPMISIRLADLKHTIKTILLPSM